jgi:hypothetical protein
MTQTILILDRKRSEFVSATFHDDVTIDQMNEAEMQWKPIRDGAVQRLLAAGKTKVEVQRLFQHAHWDWSRKAGCLADAHVFLFESFHNSYDTLTLGIHREVRRAIHSLS